MSGRMRRSLPLAAAAAAAALLALAGCTPPDEPPRDGEGALPAARLEPLVAEIPDRPSAAPERVETGLAAPTNRWYSGLVLPEDPQPVFPLPLSFQLTGSGFALGVPVVGGGGAVVTAPANPELAVEAGADGTVLVRGDEVSAELELRAGSEPLGRVVLARGSPVVSYVAQAAHELALGAPVAGEPPLTEFDDRRYAVLAPDGALAGDGRIALEAGQDVRLVAIPPGADPAAVAEAAGSPLEGVEVGFELGPDAARTILDYRTESGGTLLAVTPAQRAGLAEPAECGLGSFTTLAGELELCRGESLAWDVPLLEPAAALELDGLDEAAREELRATLADDAGRLEFPPDSYFGGKALARVANLAELARALDEPDIAEELHARLAEQLRLWAEPDGCEGRDERCLTFDSAMGGVVGRTPSFGSDEFNDHHFHYGYLLHAAALAARDDAELREEIAPAMTLLAADLASGADSPLFPARRAFDPYLGHSWASGTAPFADGNNQESSSEAVNAANALALWADVAGDEELAAQSRWMLSAESAAAAARWTAFDRGAAPYDRYDHEVVGIVWDGKLEFGTWFSPEPSAVLGIQLVPMGPAQLSLPRDAERIRAQLEEARSAGPPPQFADYLLMYQALAGPEEARAALEAARELPEDAIDDGLSRSHLLAWIHRLTKE